MTVDLDALLPTVMQVVPVLLLLLRESTAWRAELASWRRELSGARIVIEPAGGRKSSASEESSVTEDLEPPALPAVEVWGPGVAIQRPRR